MKPPRNNASKAARPGRFTNDDTIDFEALNARALEHLDSVLEDLLDLDTKPEGKEILMLNPHRVDGDFGSFKVNTETGKWSDFADFTGDAAGGDIISLIAYIEMVSQVAAAKRLQAFLSQGDNITALQKEVPAEPRRAPPGDFTMPDRPPTKAKVSLVAPQTAAKSPAKAGEAIPPVCPRASKVTPIVYEYNDVAGLPVAVVIRYDEQPRKTFLPKTLIRNATGRLEWIVGAPAAPRSLYGLDRLAASAPDTPVLICEGEKAADAASKLFPTLVAMTTMGGAAAPGNSDFSPLKGRKVAISPDNDEAGEKYLERVIDLARAAGATVNLIQRFPKEVFGKDKAGNAREVPKGYDLADALHEGWTPEGLATLSERLFERIDNKAKPEVASEAKPEVASEAVDAKVAPASADRRDDEQTGPSSFRVEPNTDNSWS
jgi:hypothetical protein